jgi:hypothetical protein
MARHRQAQDPRNHQHHRPARHPELNPVENISQFMRNNWLSNRVFTACDTIAHHCCKAANTLINQPWRIMSIGMRQGAHGA